jgi:putative FmdB family regulatory protein
MPIYEYRCGDCGQKKDFLQKVNDAPIDTCPACGSKSYAKALTAAGFQLKGNGWYATDFKSGSTAKESASPSEGAATTEAAKTSDTATTKPESSAGGACSTGCACH